MEVGEEDDEQEEGGAGGEAVDAKADADRLLHPEHNHEPEPERR